MYSFFVFAIYQEVRAEDRLKNWANKIDPALKFQSFTLKSTKSEDKLKGPKCAKKKVEVDVNGILKSCIFANLLTIESFQCLFHSLRKARA